MSIDDMWDTYYIRGGSQVPGNPMPGDPKFGSYRPPSGNGWHTERLGELFGFCEDDISVIKAEVNATFQRWFGGDVTANAPQQFSVKQSAVRAGDPSGFFGRAFWLVRQGYYTLEHVPLVNDLRLWAAFDMLVLKDSTNATVQAYCGALRGSTSVRA